MIKVWTILAHEHTFLVDSGWIAVGFKLCDSGFLALVLLVERNDVEGLDAHAAVLITVESDALRVIAKFASGCHRRMWLWLLFPLSNLNVLAIC